MTYHPSLWKDAPDGAVGVARTFVEQADGNEYEEWIFVRPVGAETFWGWFYDGEWQSMAMPKTRFIDLYPRPQAYQSPAQLIDAYKAEHGTEIEADIEKFDEIMGGKDVGGLDDYLDSAVFFTLLIEKHLAAERARIEGKS